MSKRTKGRARSDATEGRPSTDAGGGPEPSIVHWRDERPSLLSDLDLHLFREGSHFELYNHLGAHRVETDSGEDRPDGTVFGVWAPNAEGVCVIGDFNDWKPGSDPLQPVGDTGIWETFVPGVGDGARYKFQVRSRYRGYVADKSDPFATRCEQPPLTASVVWDLAYEWRDADWMEERGQRNALDAPMSIYEMHIGSWRRVEDGRSPTWRELAPQLVEYLEDTGFTHVEFLPVTEHPFGGSWGYQSTAFFAPTSRFGDPQGLMYLIDELHRAGIGVILDWVPSHFPSDVHGLCYFDGTHLFEHADPRQGYHPEWNSYIFNYGRPEVVSFLISSAMSWLSRYHVDGLRVDAVASMLYLDYSRRAGEWIANERGGRENLDAVRFLQRLNTEVYRKHPDIQTIAEDSTAWPGVSRPVDQGGLGFGLKWDMGWMHDTLSYFERDPAHRRYHHNELTFRSMYAFSENFVLPLSHDEVVYGKGSLLQKMPGDEWRKFANLRLLLAYMFATSGKKLLFMGGEIAQPWEWNHDAEIAWELRDNPMHNGVRRLVADLNDRYRSLTALHELDADPGGFEWIVADDADWSRFCFLRKDRSDNMVAVVLNCTPEPHHNFCLGVPKPGTWHEVLNTDSKDYGGSGFGNLGAVETAPVPSHYRDHSLRLVLPPLGAVLLEHGS